MLRRTMPLCLLAGLLLSACDRGPVETAPSADPSFEMVLDVAGQGEAAGLLLARAPEALRLTEAQVAAIRRLNEAFRAENRSDYEALRAVTRDAIEARRAGATPAQIREILAQAREPRQRLATAFQALHRAIQAVLTDEQRAWLRDNHRRMGPGLPPLPPAPRG